MDLDHFSRAEVQYERLQGIARPWVYHYDVLDEGPVSSHLIYKRWPEGFAICDPQETIPKSI